MRKRNRNEAARLKRDSGRDWLVVGWAGGKEGAAEQAQPALLLTHTGR